MRTLKRPAAGAVGAAVLAGLMLAGVEARAQPAAPAPPPFAGTGPFKAVATPASGLPTHTLYAPQDLGGMKGVRLPIVAWANGACANDSNHFRSFLTEIASHGYLIVAIGPWNTAPSQPAVEPSPGGPPPDRVDPTQSSQLIDAIDWAQRENNRSGGPLEGRLATDKVAVMGQSCGGLQALDVSPDPRVVTSVILNSGIYVRPGGRSGIRIGKDKLDKLHAPVAYLIGGPTDIAYPNARDDFAHIGRVPVVIANLPLGHTGNYGLPQGGPFAPVVTAWLDWQLKGDLQAKTVFVGARCGLCGDPAWTVQSKNLH